MDDKDIIDLYFLRNERAISETMNSYGGRLKRFAMRFLSDERDIEECLNDAYRAAWNTIPPQKPDDLFAYLAALCRNAALDVVKRNTAQKRSITLVELSRELSECIPDNGSLNDEPNELLSALLNEYLDKLSKKRRSVFVGRYWFGESISDIAKRTGLSESNVKTMLHRTREGLKKHILRKGNLYE